MNAVELGKRIREARLARKMTQSELVGTFITRNMLSRIESGNACPSVKTLEYLAQRLELPPGSLMSAPSQEEIENNPAFILNAKEHYVNKEYEAAAEQAQRIIDSEFFDEGSAILARCHIMQAKEAAEKGEYTVAAKMAKSAMQFSDDGIYKSREISMEAMLLLQEIATKASS